jgi:hemoglobin
VVSFYREIVFDDLLGPVFGEVAEVDWSVHIPKLIDYWCRVLLGQPGYDGFMLAPHQHVHELEALRPELFDRWYSLFVDAVDVGWEGPVSERAKSHAGRMAATLARRILNVDWTPPRLAREVEPVQASLSTDGEGPPEVQATSYEGRNAAWTCT